MGSSIARPSLAMEAELSERQKWELSPVEQLKVAVYRRQLGNAEMRQGHAQEVQQSLGKTRFIYIYKLIVQKDAKTREGML